MVDAEHLLAVRRVGDAVVACTRHRAAPVRVVLQDRVIDRLFVGSQR